MPSLQSFIATFNNISGGNSADSLSGEASGAKKSASDQFSSLLDVVGNIEVDNNPSRASFRASSKKTDIKDPVAVDVPSVFRDSANKTATKDVTRSDVSNKKQVERSSESSDDVRDSKANFSQKTDAPKPIEKKDTAQSTQSTPKTDKLESSADKSSVGAVEDVSTDNELKTESSDKVDNLNNLLDIISQLLAGAGGVVVSVATEVQVTELGDDSVLPVDELQDALDPLAVFADIKAVLSQLQQFLQAVNTQNTPLTEEQNATLAAINNALQNDLSALKNLLPQTADGDDVQSIFNQLLQTKQVSQAQKDASNVAPQPVFTAIADVKTLLQNDISLIKDMLQKFKNDVAPLPLKLEVAAPQLQVETIDAASGNDNSNVLNLNLRNNKVESAIPAVEQSQSQQILQPQNNNNTLLSPAAAAVQAAIAGGDADANTGGNSGQQSNNAGQQFSTAGLTASSARSTGGIGTTQFSNLLNSTSQTPVTEQVVFHIKSAVGNGMTRISIQLHPEDLGRLDITLDVDTKGKTGVTIIADNKQTLDLLQRDLQNLQKALSDAGLKSDPDSLSFNLRGGDREGQGQNQFQAANQYQKMRPDELPPEDLNIASLATVTRSYTVKLPDGLDIKI
jgi:flagellar hook-length control protein FliK